jgi:hypothetical protein
MKNLIIVVLVVVVGLALFINSRPSTYSVSRSATIAAPADSVFARVNDFHRWNDWSPWARLDPNMKTELTGAEAGTGAVYYWTGDKKVGEGRMTITDSQPPGHVVIHLEFIKPFADVCTTTFTVEPEGGASKVTWSMSGATNFISKAMCLFTSMDKMIGPDFERGLGQLKTLAEAAPAAAAAPDSSAAQATTQP